MPERERLKGFWTIAMRSSMPFCPIPGQSKAFLRLQEEIIRTSTDQSIFAWDWSDEDMSLLFAPSIARFRSRARQVRKCGADIIGSFHATQDQHITKSFRVTNEGLEICLPLEDTRTDITKVALNCHIGGKCVTLDVLKVGDSTYVVQRAYASRPMGIDACSQWVVKSVVLLRSQSASRVETAAWAERRKSYKVISRVWVNMPGETGGGLEIVAGYPVSAWSSASQCFSPFRGFNHDRRWYIGCLLCRCPGAAQTFIISFEVCPETKWMASGFAVSLALRCYEPDDQAPCSVEAMQEELQDDARAGVVLSMKTSPRRLDGAAHVERWVGPACRLPLQPSPQQHRPPQAVCAGLDLVPMLGDENFVLTIGLEEDIRTKKVSRLSRLFPSR